MEFEYNQMVKCVPIGDCSIVEELVSKPFLFYLMNDILIQCKENYETVRVMSLTSR
jgi:hypothetical protein